MGLNTLFLTSATSHTTETTVISVLPWWWSKNNCTIARHDSRKKNYFCIWKEPKGTTSICLPHGRLSLLFIVSGAVVNATSCSSHLSLCPLAGSGVPRASRAPCSPLRRPPRVTEPGCLRGSGTRREAASQSVQITRLAAQRRCKALPTALESATLLPKGCPLSFPVERSPASREGRGMVNPGRNSLKAREQIAAGTGISVLVGG